MCTQTGICFMPSLSTTSLVTSLANSFSSRFSIAKYLRRTSVKNPAVGPTWVNAYSRVDCSSIYMQKTWRCDMNVGTKHIQTITQQSSFWSLPCLPLPSYAYPFGSHANRVRYWPSSAFPLRAGPAITSLASKVNSRQQSRKHVMRQVFRSVILPTWKHSMGGGDTTVRHGDGLPTWLLARRDSRHPFLCLASRNQIWPSASRNY